MTPKMVVFRVFIKLPFVGHHL